jgi:hypothetical protein
MLGLLAYLGAMAVLTAIPLLLPTGPTLLSVPGWVLRLASLLTFIALGVLQFQRRDPVVDPRR